MQGEKLLQPVDAESTTQKILWL